MQSNLTPVTDALSKEYVYVDNELQDAIKKVSLFSILSRLRIRKRSGDSIRQVVFATLVWPLLPVKSISSFCGKFLQGYIKAGMNVIYDFLKREDINWRSVGISVAKEVYLNHNLGMEKDSAFNIDDSIKHRRGKKVEGVSSHFDHTETRHVMGQQVLQLGLATAKGFLPLDQQIYIGNKKAQGLQAPFQDQRHAVAKDYQCALQEDKNTMFRSMLKRALKNGFKSSHVNGDSWFGNKGNIASAIDLLLIGLFMMKRGNLSYRFQGRNYTAKMLYELIKRKMTAQKGQRFLTYSLLVELNLTEKKSDPPRWVTVKLVFSKSRKCQKDTWVVLLCTNPDYTIEKILRIYALRWSIEVYFKEVKQNMGFLKEQTGNYVVHYASIHLAAIRYCLFFNLMLDNGSLSFGEIRSKITGQLEKLSFATVLWELFKSLIHGTLDRFERCIGTTMIKAIKKAIEGTVEDFLKNALQMDEASCHRQIKAEALGVL